MESTKHIYHPEGDVDLGSQLREYRKIRLDYLRAKASLEHIHDPDWKDTLGSEEEIKEALKILEDSLTVSKKYVDPISYHHFDKVDALTLEELEPNKENLSGNKQTG